MKKILLILVVIAMMIPVTSCRNVDPTPVPATSEDSLPATEAPTEAPTEPEPQDPVIPEVSWEPIAENLESVKILSIGNSFSVDSMEYLWDMLRSVGYQNVTLGILYYGGCSLAQHVNFMTNDTTDYVYFKNNSGTWVRRNSTRASYVMADEDWDIITIQDSAKVAGLASSYEASLSTVVDYVRSKNQTAKLVWHMVWADQSDSTRSAFITNYNRDQMKMYAMFIDCTRNLVMTEDSPFCALIPTGTVIQIARTSFLGDHLTRDGHHLNYTYGRYLAALTWTCRLAGIHPLAVTYNPCPGKISEDMFAVAREAVAEGLAYPYELTISSYPTGTGKLYAE